MASHLRPIASLLVAAVLSTGCSENGDDAVAPTSVTDSPPPTSGTRDDGTSAVETSTIVPTTTATTTTTTTELPVTITGPPPDEGVPSGADDPRVVWAIDESSDHFGYPRDEIELASIEAVTWPTAALGCPATGRTYAEVEVPGYRITLTWADVTIVYHGAADGSLPFRCDFLD